MLTPKQQQFLVMAAGAAVASERATKLPATLTVAQAVWESGWGSRMPGNNCFGIKPDHHGSGVQYFVSNEFINGAWRKESEAFEKYDTLADCFNDHARLITQGAPYQEAWERFLQDGDVDGVAARVSKVYGTDPQYAEHMLNMMHSQAVSQAVAAARVMAA